MSPPSILVLGATGVSGLAFIHEALSQPSPPKLMLYVRSRAKLPADIDSLARVVIGELGDEKALEVAMEGVDTVVSFLGAYVSLSAFLWRTTSTPIADSLKVVLKVMKANGVKRILALSTPAFYVSPEQSPSYLYSFFVYAIPALLVPQGSAEMKAIAQLVSADDSLEWTVFRVPHLNEGAADRRVWAGLLGKDFEGSAELSRASQARWVLREIGERKWVRGAPALGNY